MKTYRYKTLQDDLVQSRDQNYILPKDYRRVRTDALSKFSSALVYGLALFLSAPLLKLIFGVSFHGRKKLKKARGGYFLYSNHTQPVGDVFLPALCAFPKRIYTVVSHANYGIPVIGRLLPYLGAIPVPRDLHDTEDFQTALKLRAERGHPIVIFPEAHVWPYYTEIRPFPDTSFAFPVRLDLPVFTMTVTYQKRRFAGKPGIKIFVDGPFFPEGTTARQKRAFLCLKAKEAMEMRSRESNFDDLRYEKA